MKLKHNTNRNREWTIRTNLGNIPADRVGPNEEEELDLLGDLVWDDSERGGNASAGIDPVVGVEAGPVVGVGADPAMKSSIQCSAEEGSLSQSRWSSSRLLPVSSRSRKLTERRESGARQDWGRGALEPRDEEATAQRASRATAAAAPRRHVILEAEGRRRGTTERGASLNLGMEVLP